jgi:hypothetical protein
MMKALSENKNMEKIPISNKYRVVKSLINRGFVKKPNNNYEISDSLIKYYIENNKI